MSRRELEGASREDLVLRAEALGIAGASARTTAELAAAIAAAEENQRSERRGRGWFGRARDLLTSVIDRGLNLPPEASRNRPEGRGAGAPPPPLPTVTLAEIYAAQGHLDRAIATLDEVISREPEHTDALSLRGRFVEQLRRTRPAEAPRPIETRLETPVGESGGAVGEVERKAVDEATSPSQPEAELETDDEVSLALTEEESGPTQAERTVEQLLDLERFEIDEVVAVAVDPHTVYLYWEVRPLSLAEARDKHPYGALVVRVASLTPSTSGVSSELRDLRVDALHGELFVRGLPSGTHVRVTIGYAHPDGFEPFAVGVEVHTPRAHRAALVASRFARWSEGGSPVELAQEPRGLAGAGASTGSWGEAPTPHERASGLPRVESGASFESFTADEAMAPPTFTPRAPGSSELLRRGAPWSRSVRWPSSLAMR
jgi:hypothetical protein